MSSFFARPKPNIVGVSKGRSPLAVLTIFTLFYGPESHLRALKWLIVSSKVLSKLGFCPFKPKIPEKVNFFEVKFPNTGQHPSFCHIQTYNLIHQHTKARKNCGTSQVSQFQV